MKECTHNRYTHAQTDRQLQGMEEEEKENEESEIQKKMVLQKRRMPQERENKN